MTSATYSPEDNKLRLYAAARLPRDLYERVKVAGFQWAPKQELFVAPRWTPAREDLLLELCDEIGDEGYSTTERAADRAESAPGLPLWTPWRLKSSAACISRGRQRNTYLRLDLRPSTDAAAGEGRTPGTSQRWDVPTPRAMTERGSIPPRSPCPAVAP